MKLQDALNTLGLDTGNVTLDQVKTAYRKACAKYHPDRNPAGLEMMKAVNAAMDMLKGLDWSQDVTVEDSDNNNYGESLNNALNAVVGLEGIEIEICGSWVWLSGNTYPYKDAIKSAGFKWASAKKRWYFRPAEWASTKARGTMSMDQIREVHGSTTVKLKQRKTIK